MKIQNVSGIMINHIKGGYEELLKGVTRTFQWIKNRGYVEIPKYSEVEQ